MKKVWWKSKTYWFNITLAGVGILQANQGLLENNLGKHYGLFVVAVAFIGVALRSTTTTGIHKKII